MSLCYGSPGERTQPINPEEPPCSYPVDPAAVSLFNGLPVRNFIYSLLMVAALASLSCQIQACPFKMSNSSSESLLLGLG